MRINQSRTVALPPLVGVVAAAMSLVLFPARAQPSGLSLGPITVDCTKMTGESTQNTWHCVGGVTVSSEDASTAIHLSASSADINQPEHPVSGRLPLASFVAHGNPAAGKQVSGHYDDKDNAQTYDFWADKVVFVRDTTRINGGKIDFIGHVKLDVRANVALARPSETTCDQYTIYLGPKPDYPKVEGTNMHMVLTPNDTAQ